MNIGRKMRRVTRRSGYMLLFLLTCVVSGSIIRSLKEPVVRKPQTLDQEWAARSYGYAPHPDDFDQAIIQVYAARTRGAKKALAVHTWIATKRKGADTYIISQIFGWRLRPGGTALNREPGIPDKSWARNEPTLLLDLRGKDVEKIIDKVEVAVIKYPWHDVYTAWPRPNRHVYGMDRFAGTRAQNGSSCNRNWERLAACLKDFWQIRQWNRRAILTLWIAGNNGGLRRRN